MADISKIQVGQESYNVKDTTARAGLQTLTTESAAEITASVNSTTYVCTFQLKNAAGMVISRATIDLPLESVVVSGSYDSASQSIILTLQNGESVTIPVADLVDGLASTDGTYPDMTVGNATNAVNAETAESAATAETATNALQLGGIAAGGYSRTYGRTVYGKYTGGSITGGVTALNTLNPSPTTSDVVVIVQGSGEGYGTTVKYGDIFKISRSQNAAITLGDKIGNIAELQGVLSLSVNGGTPVTFNGKTNVTFNVPVPTALSQLINDAGFVYATYQATSETLVLA